MPLIPQENFSNWYLLNLDGNDYIIQSYNETLDHNVQDVKYIQADIGNHIVSISPKKYNLSLNSPLIIVDHDNSFDIVNDLYTLALQNLYQIQQPITINNYPDYIFKSANIQLGQECSITTQLEGWQEFTPNLNYIQNPLDFTARLVKNYDVKISVFGSDFLIQSGTLNISVNTSTNYYVSGSNNFTGNVVPLYGIHGYTVTGDVVLAVTPEQYDILKFYNDQEPGIFNAFSQDLSLTILDRKNYNYELRKIEFGNFMFLPSIELNVNANQMITAKFNFVTMFRGTSQLEF